ncbi:MAG: amidohydrolase [Paenibacillaceae bacterium]|nr:amidohydrolase [Paenibacillaceae bacterium]
MSRIVFDRVSYLTPDGVIAVANIRIVEGIITEITDEAIACVPGDERISLPHKLLLPGLVNAHGHAPMSLLRGLKDDAPLAEWLQAHMWPAEARYTAADVRAGAMLAMMEMIASGTTTFLDMYDHMDVVAQAVEDVGMRAVLSRGIIGLCSEVEQAAKVAQAQAFVRDWHGAAQGRITAMVAPHALYTCPPALVETLIGVAHAYRVPLHIHLSETAHEVAQHVVQYGMRPPVHLQQLGAYDLSLVVAHAVHVDDAEIAAFAAHGVSVVHNPRSNLKLASGVAPIPQMLQAGVNVCLGTDSAASNNNLDMFQELRTAALVHKGITYDPTAVPAHAAWHMATRAGAQALQLPHVGHIAVGMQADVIAIDVRAPHLQPNAKLPSHIVYAASGADVTDVWTAGKRLLCNREYTTIDEERVRFDVAQACARIRA